MSRKELDLHILSMEDKEGSEIAEVLASESTRSVLDLLEDEPQTPKGLAEELEMSIQNIHYHIDKLSGIGLVESIDIEYSDRGREMQVYAPTHDGVVLCDQAESKAKIEEIIAKFAEGSFIAIIMSVIFHLMYDWFIRDPWDSQSLMFSRDSSTELIPWWKYPSLWVFIGIMVFTITYCVWRYFGLKSRISQL